MHPGKQDRGHFVTLCPLLRVLANTYATLSIHQSSREYIYAFYPICRSPAQKSPNSWIYFLLLQFPIMINIFLWSGTITV